VLDAVEPLLPPQEMGLESVLWGFVEAVVPGRSVKQALSFSDKDRGFFLVSDGLELLEEVSAESLWFPSAEKENPPRVNERTKTRKLNRFFINVTSIK